MNPMKIPPHGAAREAGPGLSDLPSPLFEHAPAPMAMLEGDRHILRYVNPAFCRLIHMSREELIGQPFGRMFPEDGECETVLDGVLRTGQSANHTQPTATGSPPFFAAYALWPVMENERPVGAAMQVMDPSLGHEKTVTFNEALMAGSVRQHEFIEELEKLNGQLHLEVQERQQAEAALRQSENRFRALVTASSEVVFRMSPDWSEMRELAGMEFIPDTVTPPRTWLEDYIPVEDRAAVLTKIDEAIRTRSAFELEHRVRRVDGTSGWKLSRAIPLLDAKGEITEWFGASSDVTLRKVAEEEIQRLNAELEARVIERTAELQAANEELRAFSYSVSHDLRAPFRHVLGFVGLLQTDAAATLSDKNLHLLTTISDSAQRMGQLIDDLLTFSRIGQSEMRKSKIELNELVRDTLGGFQAETKKRVIEWEIRPLPAVWGDRSLLRMALVNLISNAVKFTGHRAAAKIEIGCSPSVEGDAVIYVRDNGTGFDPRYTHKLFGVFQRLHSQAEFEGTGIGLANVQRIIHRHGGRVWAEGVIDGGATFYFTVPRPPLGNQEG